MIINMNHKKLYKSIYRFKSSIGFILWLGKRKKPKCGSTLAYVNHLGDLKLLLPS